MDVTQKNLVLISYLQSLFSDYKVKAEFSTNDSDKRVIVVQEQPGSKVVFFGDISPLFNYYQVNIWGLTIKENKNIATEIGELIGKHVIVDYGEGKWQIIFKQYYISRLCNLGQSLRCFIQTTYNIYITIIK